VTARAWLSFLRLRSHAESRNDDRDDRHAHERPPSRAFYAVIAAVVRRASLRTKKAHAGAAQLSACR
jgi:hypothetical protein